MQQTIASSTQEYLYDGDSLIAEYSSSGSILRRYVPGRGVDETLVWYEGSNLSAPNWLHTDQQGSTVAVSNSAGAATVYAYSPSGEPAGGWGSAAAVPIFRYTGQAALPQVGLYYYKARMYDPVQGRFLQTDPVGYKDEYNLYTYGGNDPVNRADPSGTFGSGFCNGADDSGCGGSFGLFDSSKIETIVGKGSQGGGTIGANAAQGRAAELEAGIPSTGKEMIVSRTGTAARRFPDRQNKTTIEEVKSGRTLSITNQMRDFVADAKATMRNLIYRISESTKIPSGTAEYLRQNNVNVTNLKGDQIDLEKLPPSDRTPVMLRRMQIELPPEIVDDVP